MRKPAHINERADTNQKKETRSAKKEATQESRTTQNQAAAWQKSAQMVQPKKWLGECNRRNRRLVCRQKQTIYHDETNHGSKIASNSRAELGATLEAPRQNEINDLEIESDPLISLRAICSHSERYEDLNWQGIQNADLLKGIMIRLRTRPARTAFTWVKGHEDNYGIRADALANEGREDDSKMRVDEDEWIDHHPALQDGARLQALGAKQTYDSLIRWHPKKTNLLLNQEKLDDAKVNLEESTGQRPTNEKSY